MDLLPLVCTDCENKVTGREVNRLVLEAELFVPRLCPGETSEYWENMPADPVAWRRSCILRLHVFGIFTEQLPALAYGYNPISVAFLPRKYLAT